MTLHTRLEARLIQQAQDAWDAYRASPLPKREPNNDHLWHLVRWCRYIEEYPDAQVPERVHRQLFEHITFDMLEGQETCSVP